MALTPHTVTPHMLYVCTLLLMTAQRRRPPIYIVSESLDKRRCRTGGEQRIRLTMEVPSLNGGKPGNIHRHSIQYDELDSPQP
jgi:hypothetical protein